MASLQHLWPRLSAIFTTTGSTSTLLGRAVLANALVITTLCVALTAEADQVSEPANADFELMFYAGGGKQPHSDTQKNTVVGVDLNFYRHVFTDKQTLFIGTGVAQLTSNTDANNRLVAYSIYPQLNLTLPKIGSSQPYFYVRTLGPTYLSETQLGERVQGNHFVFQSQLGLGLYFGDNNTWLANIAYRHYSNARLSAPNDGIDALVLLTLGGRY